MTITRIWIVALAGAPALAPCPPRAQQPVNLAMATFGSGTAWYVYGATMADLLRKALPPARMSTSSCFVAAVLSQRVTRANGPRDPSAS